MSLRKDKDAESARASLGEATELYLETWGQNGHHAIPH